jgi:hypothetical protein
MFEAKLTIPILGGDGSFGLVVHLPRPWKALLLRCRY